MSPNYKKNSLVKLALLSLILLGAFFCQKAEAAPVQISGAMWSSTIGWVSASSTGSIPYGVMLNDDNTITGTAWSNNIGWVSFNFMSDVYGKCPSYGPFVAAPVSYNPGTGRLSGYARAIAGSDAQGWDGCINFGTDQGNARYNPVTKKFSGAAWGDVNVGWLDISPLTTAPTPPTFTCDNNNIPPAGGVACDSTQSPPVLDTPWNLVSSCFAPNSPSSICTYTVPVGSCANNNIPPANSTACSINNAPTSPNTPWTLDRTCPLPSENTHICESQCNTGYHYDSVSISCVADPVLPPGGGEECHPHASGDPNPISDFANVGQLVTWTATGGTAPYSWIDNLNPVSSQTGATYLVRYYTIGNRKVTVNGHPCNIATDNKDTLPIINNPNFHPF